MSLEKYAVFSLSWLFAFRLTVDSVSEASDDLLFSIPLPAVTVVAKTEEDAATGRKKMQSRRAILAAIRLLLKCIMYLFSTISPPVIISEI